MLRLNAPTAAMLLPLALAACPASTSPVGRAPTAMLVAPARGVEGVAVLLDASASRDPHGRRLEFVFAFSDKTPIVVTLASSFPHTYLRAGTYRPCVTARVSAAGANASACAKVEVVAASTVDGGPKTGWDLSTAEAGRPRDGGRARESGTGDAFADGTGDAFADGAGDDGAPRDGSGPDAISDGAAVDGSGGDGSGADGSVADGPRRDDGSLADGSVADGPVADGPRRDGAVGDGGSD